jgi:hypothetical protein
MGIFEWLDSLLQDARYGLRQLRRTPALTLSVIVSLVVGIGANTAIFSIVDAALLKSLPVADPASLRVIDWVSQGWPKDLCNSLTGTTDGEPTGRMQGSSFAPRLYRALAHEQGAFESLMGFSDANAATIVVHGRQPEPGNLQFVSANFFQGLGVRTQKPSGASPSRRKSLHRFAPPTFSNPLQRCQRARHVCDYCTALGGRQPLAPEGTIQ